MSKDIRIRKGLDIHLLGEAEKVISELPVANVYGIKPIDFHAVIPKLMAREGDVLQAGSPVFHSKSDARIIFPSPVSGKIIEITRGERRRILEIKIEADAKQTYHEFEKKNASDLTADQVKEYLLSSGCWPFIKQRPYDVIANPDDKPKAIFVSAYDSHPLAPDYNYCLQGEEKYLQEAVSALAKLTEGQVHFSVKGSEASCLKQLKGAVIHNLSGPHPIGNVSIQIAQVNPINKGEVVWVVKPQDLVVIGKLFLTGKLDLTRTVAVTGSCVEKPHYVKAIAGAGISDILGSNLKKSEKTPRIISGNVLTGRKVSENDYLGFYDNHITVIPEGDDYDFFGWTRPIFDKVSVSRALTFSWLQPNKKYDLNTNTNGEHRAFVVTGAYEEVFPLDIYPMQLLKACIYKDLDEMEALGAYEVAPEDFALTEFICVSKQPHQQIIRDGLDLMIKEL